VLPNLLTAVAAEEDFLEEDFLEEDFLDFDLLLNSSIPRGTVKVEIQVYDLYDLSVEVAIVLVLSISHRLTLPLFDPVINVPFCPARKCETGLVFGVDKTCVDSSKVWIDVVVAAFVHDEEVDSCFLAEGEDEDDDDDEEDDDEEDEELEELEETVEVEDSCSTLSLKL